MLGVDDCQQVCINGIDGDPVIRLEKLTLGISLAADWALDDMLSTRKQSNGFCKLFDLVIMVMDTNFTLTEGKDSV